MIGQQLGGRYEVVKPLARGGMGVVYVARDPLLDREVAVKVVSPELLTADHEQRFLREARLVARLDHPGIVAIHDFGRQDGSLFFVMPLLRGESLRALLGRRRLSARETVEIGVQVAEALEHSHQAGVVHRDVKPENVMVLRDGGSGLRVKVMDFGIALASSNTRMTLAGTVFGTLAYLSPEQLTGGTVDGRSDVYALGVVLYECLAGHPPFTGDVQTVLFGIAHDAPVPPSSAGAEVDAALEQVVMRCLAKSPDERPSTAGEVALALARCRENASEGAPVAPRPRARLTADAPLVGRDAQVAEIRQRFESSREGECHLVLVGGEPGMGKTRLLAEAERLAALRGARVVHGRFLERQDAAFPYHGFGEALTEAVQRARAAGEPDPLPAEIRTRLGALFPALLDSSADPARDAAAPSSRTEVFELLANAFARLAARAPLVLLLEDLHDADVSLDALQYLLRRLASAPLLVLGSYRSNEVGPAHELRRLARAAERDAHASHLLLGPLATADRERLVWLLLHGQPLPGEVAAQVCEASEGNPFFLGELLRTLLEEGRLVQDATGSWTGARSEGELYAALPGSLQQVLVRRLEGLAAPARELLEHASVLGRSFAEDELALVGEVLETELDALLAGQYLEEERARPGRLQFASALLREVVYAAIPSRRRRLLHRRCAEQLEARSGRREASPGRLAPHFAAAGLPDRAAPLAILAADRALAAALPDDAVRFAQLALQCAEDEGWDAPPALAAVARLRLGRALALAGRADTAVHELRRALEALPRGSAERLEGLVVAAEVAWGDRRVEEARTWADEAASLAAALGDPSRQAALSGLAAAIADRGTVREGAHDTAGMSPGSEWLAQGEYLAVQESFDAARASGMEPAREADYLAKLAELAAAQGRRLEGLEHLRRAARVLATGGHEERLALTEASAASLCAELGRLEDGQLWVERSQSRVDAGDAHGPELLGAIGASRADLLLAGGQVRAAVDVLRGAVVTCTAAQLTGLQARLVMAASQAGDRALARETLEAMEHPDEPVGRARRSEALARQALAEGALDAAWHEARAGLEAAEDSGDPLWRARLQSLAARVACALGAWEDAEERVLRASRDAERTQALPEQLAVQIGLARIAAHQGRVLAAEVAARLALELTEETGLNGLRAEARLALAESLAAGQPDASREEIGLVVPAVEGLGHVELMAAARETGIAVELGAGHAEAAMLHAEALVALRAPAAAPARASARLLLARAAAACGQTADARLAAQDALRESLAAADLRTAAAAHLLLREMEPDDAPYHARVATELSDTLGPAAGRARVAARLALADTRTRAGDERGALAALGEALSIAGDTGSSAVVARGHLDAASLFARNDPWRAQALLGEARRLAAAADVPALDGEACRAAAQLALRLGRLDEAVEALRHERLVRQRTGLPEPGARWQVLMASAYHRLGDLAEARRILGEPALPSDPDAADGDLLRARVALDIGALGPAAAALQRAGEAPGAGVIAAELALWDGELGRALAGIDESRRVLDGGVGDGLESGRQREQLRLDGARAALCGGWPEAALRPAEEARRWFTEASFAVDAVEAALVLAEARARAGRGDADEPLDAADEAAERLGLGLLKVDARLLRARIHGRPALADEAYEQALSLSALSRVAAAARVSAELRARAGDPEATEWSDLADSALDQMGQSRLAPLRAAIGLWGPEVALATA